MEVNSEVDALKSVVSDDWAAREAAGRWLADNAGPQYRAELLALLTDTDNTAVSMGTAWALLEKPSEFSVSMVMTALASADAMKDDETLEHLLFTVTPFLFQPSPPPALRESLDLCMATADPQIAAGLKLAGLA